MVLIHAVWCGDRLHLWGERRVDELLPQAECPGHSFEGDRPQRSSFAISCRELRSLLGEVWDGLLVSVGQDASLLLRLPHADGRLASPWQQSVPSQQVEPVSPPVLATCKIATISFEPADAVDLLTAPPSAGPERPSLAAPCGGAPLPGTVRWPIGHCHPSKPAVRAASVAYWGQVARLALDLLAQQRFVPDCLRVADDRYVGHWRVVVDSKDALARLASLIASMPPVCRAAITLQESVQAAEIVESFLFTVVDALVRRCIEADELAHILHEQEDGTASPQMRWLQSLVRRDPTLRGDAETCRQVHERVRAWLARIEQRTAGPAHRVGFQLHPPPGDDAAVDVLRAPWRLTVHVQSQQEPSLIVDAASVFQAPTGAVTILERPFRQAAAKVREDLDRAARHFPPLATCGFEDGGFGCPLSLAEAYRFLRDAAPVLQAEGFAVWLPPWWHHVNDRLQLEMHVRPSATSAGPGSTAFGLDALVDYDWKVALGDLQVSAEELSALAAAQVPLVRLRGRWLELPPDDLATALRFLQKEAGGRSTLFEALRRCYFAEGADTGLRIGGLKATDWIDRLLNASQSASPDSDADQPIGFHGTLRPYQLRGLKWLRFVARHGLGACLADDMGLGKTVQLIALWLAERENGAATGPTLLVVPMSLVGNWHRELSRFAPSLRVMVHHGLQRLTGEAFVREVARFDVVISTYALIQRDFEHLASVPWHRVALDEAQNIKNPAAKQSMAVRALRSDQRVALTGTPLENRLTELWSIVDFLNQGYLGSAGDFRRRFAVPIERFADQECAERLRRLIRPVILRRLKSDPGILDELPEKLEMTVYCNLTREQAALYQSIVQEMLGQVEHSGGMRRRGLILATLVKLKQVCNHPLHFLGQTGPLARRSGKCDRLTDMLEEVVAEGDRALVFTQFRVMGDLLRNHLAEALGCRVLFLHGGTPQKQRTELVDRFQAGDADAPVFVLSLKAGGFGLNLSAANHVFHFDRWWNPAVEAQATDRAHRIGQRRQVQVHKFVCIGTLEERIAALIERKQGLAERIIGAGEEWITELSSEALRELLVLSSEAVGEE